MGSKLATEGAGLCNLHTLTLGIGTQQDLMKIRRHTEHDADAMLPMRECDYVN